MTNKNIYLTENLLSIDPTDDDFMFRVALLCFDKQKFNLSEKYFNILLSKSYAPDNINFFLWDRLTTIIRDIMKHYFITRGSNKERL